MSTDPLVALTERPDFQAWLALLRAYGSLSRRLERDLSARVGISLPWFEVLIRLHTAGGRMRLLELTAAMVVSKASVTKLTDRMEAAGMVARETDGRAVYAALTEAGRQTLATAMPVQVQNVARMMSPLTPDDLDAMRTLLIDLTNGLPQE